MRSVLLVLSLAGLATPALAQSVNYRYEVHSARFSNANQLKAGVNAPFRLHRFGIFDESGAFAAALSSAASAREVGRGTSSDGKGYITYQYEARPIVPGIRAGVEFAFEGPTSLDADGDVEGVDKIRDFDYLELRLLVGTTIPVAEWGYAIIEPLDLLLRDVSGRANGSRVGSDSYCMSVGAELGILIPFGRVGAYGRYDWGGGLMQLLSMGDEDPLGPTYDYGLAAAVGKERVRLEARLGRYRWSGTAGGSQVNDVEGTQLGLGLNVGF